MASERRHRAVANAAWWAGAVLVGVSAAIHLHLWADGYRHIPTIGPLFLVQATVGLLLAVALLATRRVIVAVAGIGFLLASIGALLVSDFHGLFGLRDTLSVPYATTSLLVEIAGTAALALGAVLRLGVPAPRRTPATLRPRHNGSRSGEAAPGSLLGPGAASPTSDGAGESPDVTIHARLR